MLQSQDAYLQLLFEAIPIPSKAARGVTQTKSEMATGGYLPWFHAPQVELKQALTGRTALVARVTAGNVRREKH